MTVFRHVTRINVSLWGERVGTIVESPQRGVYAFRFANACPDGSDRAGGAAV